MTGRRWLVSVAAGGGVLQIAEDAAVARYVAGQAAPDGWAWYSDEQLAYLHARLSSVEPHRFLPGLEGPGVHPAYYPMPGAVRGLFT